MSNADWDTPTSGHELDQEAAAMQILNDNPSLGNLFKKIIKEGIQEGIHKGMQEELKKRESLEEKRKTGKGKQVNQINKGGNHDIAMVELLKEMPKRGGKQKMQNSNVVK